MENGGTETGRAAQGEGGTTMQRCVWKRRHCSIVQYQVDWNRAVPWARSVWSQECRVAPERVEGCADCLAVRWARRKQAGAKNEARLRGGGTDHKAEPGRFGGPDRRAEIPKRRPDGAYAIGLGEEGDTEVWGELKSTG